MSTPLSLRGYGAMNHGAGLSIRPGRHFDFSVIGTLNGADYGLGNLRGRGFATDVGG